MGEASLTNNHSRDAVPDEETVSGVAIAVVIIGVGITLPAFVVGAKVVSALGLFDGLIATLCGGVLTAVLALFTMRIGALTRLSTYSLIGFCFGRWGSSAANLLLALTLLGWYGVTATLFGDALSNSIQFVFDVKTSPLTLTMLGGVLMVVTTVFGFRAIDRLSRIAVPLLVAVLLYGVWRVFDGADFSALLVVPPTPTGKLDSVPSAVSVLIGSFIVGVTLTPDLSRFARSGADALPAAVLSYGIGYPFILLLAGLPILLSEGTSLIAAMETIGLGVWALIVMVFATWTTNVNNLYSASLSVARVFPRVPDWTVTIACGVLGTLMAMAGIMDVFVDFLILLGVFIPPIAGVYLTDYFLLSNGRIKLAKSDASEARVLWPGAIAWVVGSAWGLAIYNFPGLDLSGVPAIDTLGVGMLSYFALMKGEARQARFQS